LNIVECEAADTSHLEMSGEREREREREGGREREKSDNGKLVVFLEYPFVLVHNHK
jgi:hypothetical protein